MERNKRPALVELRDGGTSGAVPDDSNGEHQLVVPDGRRACLRTRTLAGGGSFSLPKRKLLHECPLSEKVRFTVFGQALQELLCDHDGTP